MWTSRIDAITATTFAEKVAWARGVLGSKVAPAALGPGVAGMGRAQAEEVAPEMFAWSEPIPTLIPATRTYTFSEATAALATGSKGLSRFAGTDSGISASSPELSLGANLYVYLIRQGARPESRLLLLAAHGWHEWLVAGNYAAWASWMNGRAKKLTRRLGRDWWVLAELATLSGYATTDDADFYEDVRSWVHDRHEFISPFVGVPWLDAFEAAVYAVLDEASKGKPPPDGPTLAEWCGNPLNWGLQGSGFEVKGRRTFVTSTSGEEKTMKTKWSMALGLTPASVLADIVTPARQVAKAVMKQETKKVRAVVAADAPTYWKQKYPDTFLRPLLYGSPLSTLWMTPAQRETTKAELAAGGPTADVDQTKFDHSITLAMVLVMLIAIAALLLRDRDPGGPTDDIRLAMWNVVFALNGGKVIVGSAYLSIQNGILSGWLWTALLDTLANLAELFLAEAVIFPRHGNALLVKCAQGDDLHTRLISWGAVVDLLWVYAYMKIPANFSKSMSDPVVSEFLRAFGDSSEHRVQGYPARAVNGILWRNPLNDTERPGQQRLSGVFERWNNAGGRLQMDSVPEACIADLARGNRLAPWAVRSWLATPNALGGAGILTDTSHVYLKTTTARRRYFGLFPSRSHLPGIAAVVDSAERLGLRAPAAAVDNWANSLLRFGPRTLERHSDWESATFDVAVWDNVFITPAPPITLARELTPEEVQLLQIFPSDANCAALGNPRPPGVALRWWVAFCTSSLGAPNPRIWGASAEWTSTFSRATGRELASGFLRRRGSKRWETWKCALATAEVQERAKALERMRSGPFVAP